MADQLWLMTCIREEDCLKTVKHTIKLFSPLDSHAILVFTYQMLPQHFDGDPLIWASNADRV